MDRSRVVLAELLRTRGNRGEVLARSFTDIPGRFEKLDQAWSRLPDGSDVPVKIENAWRHKEDWVLKFSGVDSISQAEVFCGADLWVQPDQRVPLEEGQYYQTDLIGCRVLSAVSGELVGVVQGWQEYGSAPLMEVVRDGREVLVPFAPAFCRQIDLASGCIVMDLPEGLLDL